MWKKVLLTKAEKKVIKKISRIQVNNLQEIINRDSAIDITMYIINEELPEDKLMQLALQTLMQFQEVLEVPNKLFNLNHENLRIAKHIMWNYTDYPKYDVGRTRVWSKMLLTEQICQQ